VNAYDSPDPGDADKYRHTQVAMVRGQRVLRKALSNPSVARLDVILDQKDPLAWLESRLRAELLDHTYLMRVWVKGGSPKEQAEITNAVVYAYLTEVVNAERNQGLKRLEDIESLYKQSEKTVTEKREILERLTEALYPDMPVGRQLQEQVVGALQGEHLRARAELRRLRLEREALDDAPGATAEEADVERALKQDPQLSRLRDEAARLETRVAELAQKTASPEKVPEYGAARDKLKEAQKTLAARREQVRAEAVARLRERLRTEQRDAGARLDRKIKLLEKLSAQLGEEMGKELNVLSKVSKVKVSLKAKEQEISAAEERLSKVRAQKDRIQGDLLRTSARVTLLQEAEAPR
jgi:chromosome segregation ATPase